MIDPSQLDYSDTYSDDPERSPLLNQNIKPIHSAATSRDPRSKTSSQQNVNVNKQPNPRQEKNSKKKNLSSGTQNYGPNDYKNVYMARNRLLHDLNDLPTEILKETYLKNQQRQFRNNKFQQRDLRYRENDDLNKTDNIEEQVKNGNFPESLWDLESEKELEDRENGYWRGKRDTDNILLGIPRITSTGENMLIFF